MADEKPENDEWADLLIALAATWGAPDDVEPQPVDYGERLLAAARSVSRGNLS